MVQVERPAEAKSDSSSDASTENQPTLAKSDRGDERPRRTFRFREDFPDDAAPVDSNAAVDVGQSQSIGPQEVAPTRELAPPPVLERRTASGISRQWLLIGAAALAGIVLAVVVFAALARSGRDSVQKTSGNASKEEQEIVTSETTKSPESDDSPVGTSESANEQTQSADGSQAAEDKDTANASVASQDPGGDSPRPNDVADAPHDSVDQRSTDTGSSDVEETRDAPAVQPSAMESGGDSTRQPGDEQIAQQPEDATDVSDAPLADELANQLALAVAGVEFEGTPLPDFIRFVSDLAAVPITLDVDALRWSGIDLETTIEIKLQGTTIAQMLDQALEPLELVYRAEQNQLLVTVPTAVTNSLESRAYPVGDVAQDAESLQQLATQLQQLIAPFSWQDAGGAGLLALEEETLHVEQTQPVHYQLQRFLDKLRIVMGLNVQGNLPASEVGSEPAFQQAEGLLNQAVMVSFPETTTLRQVIERLRSETEMRVLVDWRMLAVANLFPNSETRSLGESRSLADWLESWLAQRGLGYRVIAANAIEITTGGALAEKIEVEIYRVANPPATELQTTELVTRVERAVGQRHFRSGGGQGTVIYHPASQSLIAALPQPQQRQLAVWMQVSQTGVPQ
jgi:hypothetical protein